MANVRSLDLWELVCWTYRDQKAHLYLRSPGNFYEWVLDQQDIRHELDINVPVHFDAAMVHGTVVEIAEHNFLAAQLIMQHAVLGERPDLSTAAPRPYPVHPDEGRMRNDDRPSWHQIGGRRIRSVIRSDEKIQVIEHVVKKAKKGRLGAVEQRYRFEPVEYCPLEWSPSTEFVDMVNSIYREWTEAMIQLRLRLEDENLRNHHVTGFSFEPAPSFEEPDLAAGQRDPDIAARIQPLTGFAEGVTWVKGSDGKTTEPKPWRYRRVVRASIVRQPHDMAEDTRLCA